MKIARKALYNVFSHCTSQLTLVGQGSHVIGGKVLIHGMAIGLNGEGMRYLKLH